LPEYLRMKQNPVNIGLQGIRSSPGLLCSFIASLCSWQMFISGGGGSMRLSEKVEVLQERGGSQTPPECC